MLDVKKLCHETRIASRKLLSLSTEKKNNVLTRIKELILENEEAIIACNKTDLRNAEASGISSAFMDRLTLTHDRIITMCRGIDDVIILPDYVGLVEESYTVSSGLLIEKVHAPLGVIGIIYEARPNVTIDAAILCIKSGNGVVLKGGKEALNSNRCLVSIMKKAFVECGLDGDCVAFIDGVERELTEQMLKCSEDIDVVIPRGGEGLKKYVLSTATMPVIASSGGNCHVYVEKTADLDMAYKIVENAKISRPSVCNAAETLLVDKEIAQAFLKSCLERLASKGVEIRGEKEIKQYYDNVKLIDSDEFYTEYHDMIIKVKVVDGCSEAIEHINKYNTNHSEAIVTKHKEMADKFCTEVDAGAVYVNASTRFTDGFEFGLGAEMGISTQKLHVRGPIGLKELTSVKYVIKGNGHIR